MYTRSTRTLSSSSIWINFEQWIYPLHKIWIRSERRQQKKRKKMSIRYTGNLSSIRQINCWIFYSSMDNYWFVVPLSQFVCLRRFSSTDHCHRCILLLFIHRNSNIVNRINRRKEKRIFEFFMLKSRRTWKRCHCFHRSKIEIFSVQSQLGNVGRIRGKKHQNEFGFDLSTSEHVLMLNAIYKRISSVFHWRCIENSLRLKIDWSQTNAIIWPFRLCFGQIVVWSPNDFKCRSPLGNQADFHEWNWIPPIRPWKLIKNYFYIFCFSVAERFNWRLL